MHDALVQMELLAGLPSDLLDGHHLVHTQLHLERVNEGFTTA
jgi:hypothetical protein